MRALMGLGTVHKYVSTAQGKGWLLMHYVIGDIHGCFDELMNLIQKIETADPHAQICFLGDFPDRGPKVKEAVEWMLQNVTANGKYQSVRGNHEQQLIDWSRDKNRETYIDYNDYIENTYGNDERKIKEIADFFDTLPFNKKIGITLKNEARVTYRICHAAHRDGLKGDELKYTNLWERDYCGKGNADEITVCGHTPTLEKAFNLRGAHEDMPGFICYRHRMINVDCGRCYPYENYGISFIAGICLETLEEYYDAAVEERIMEYAASDWADWDRQLYKNSGFTDDKEIIERVAEDSLMFYIEKYGRKTFSRNRKQIIEKFGFPAETPYILERITGKELPSSSLP